ncbi:hypothetical protein J3459_009739 [Metarhizium acridum]|uniref:uncharacterized protein n=1 Tax=Metarhizium acridum TaxID=92637 RepID=UPI001C6B1F4E|nr:hypothetical protein J3458_008927 [Metarhizium acridum]KAG8425721.1 hypothetical protein J3459_009739 [Metarhizium acridum]
MSIASAIIAANAGAENSKLQDPGLGRQAILGGEPSHDMVISIKNGTVLARFRDPTLSGTWRVFKRPGTSTRCTTAKAQPLPVLGPLNRRPCWPTDQPGSSGYTAFLPGCFEGRWTTH